MSRGLLVVLWPLLILLSNASTADTATVIFRGTIALDPKMAHHVSPEDRLVLKLYYPAGGIEKDQTFQIVPDPKFPLEFAISPSILMSGDTKWSAYVVEAFTDKDHNVLSVAPGELGARTPSPLPIGTRGIVLELGEY